eukprot:TRINITY_DN30109_c0_g1_i1.p1 TRINITY_DN30109_c0_g1~~TRINITY_DN30109_c0_g1_i1.p1  ORF type:complete len:1279 (+),score=429.01 TRINITY_DN30109_c0_g1_i1:116-3952(+)
MSSEDWAPPPPSAADLPAAVLCLVSDSLSWQDRVALSGVCKAWQGVLDDEACWRTAFMNRYSTLAKMAAGYEAQAGGEKGWWTRVRFADAWTKHGYALLVAIDDLLDSLWVRYAFDHEGLVSYGDTLLQKLQAVQQNRGRDVPGLRHAMSALEALLTLAPYTGFWSLCSLNLTRIEEAYIPAIRQVQLDSMTEIRSEILIALQKSITGVVIQMEEATGVAFSDEALQALKFRDLLGLGLHEHVARVEEAHRNLQDMIQPVTWITEMMAKSLLVPTEDCIEPDGALQTRRICGFRDTLSSIRTRLEPTLDSALGFVSQPFDADLALVLAFADQLTSAGRTMSKSEAYYASGFVKAHYGTDYEGFVEINSRYAAWVRRHRARATMYDFCFFAAKSGGLDEIVRDVADLDRCHVVRTVCTTLPELLFYDFQRMRQDLLTAERIEDVPKACREQLLPFFPRRALHLRTCGVAEGVATGHAQPVQQIVLEEADVAFTKPLFISTTSTPLPRGADTQKWTIHGMVDFSARGQGSAAAGCPQYNTAPLWLSLVGERLKQQAHVALTSEFPYTSAEVDLIAVACQYSPVLIEVAVGLFCSHHINAALAADDPVRAVADFRDAMARFRRDAVARRIALGHPQSHAAPVLTYYIDAAEDILSHSRAAVDQRRETWGRYRHFVATTSQLGVNFNALDICSGSGTARYGFSVMQSHQGTFFATRMRSVETIVDALCAPPDGAGEGAQPTMPCLYFERADAHTGPVALELLLDSLSASLGRHIFVAECKDLTEEAVVRYFAACSASGWVLLLRGINLTPPALLPLLSKTVESLLISKDNWESVGDWQGWPIREMPTAQTVGFSTSGVAIATLEEGPGAAYQPAAEPMDYTQVEACLPWDVLQHVSMLWVPNESATGYVTARLHRQNILLDRRDVEALFDTISSLTEAARRPLGSEPPLTPADNISDAASMHTPRPRSTTLSYLQLFRHISRDTQIFLERLAAMAGDFVAREPACICELPVGQKAVELPHTEGAAPFFTVLGIILESLMDEDEYTTFCAAMDANLAARGSAATFRYSCFEGVRATLRAALERQGYGLTPQLRNGGLALLVASRFYPVSVVITSTPQQEFTQGLSTLIKHVPHLSGGFFTILLEGELAGGKFADAMWRALKESKEKAGEGTRAGCWILLRLTQKTMCNHEVMGRLADVARTQRVAVPPRKKKNADGDGDAAPHDDAAEYVEFGDHIKLLVIVDRQYRALERVLPFVAPIQLSFGEKEFVLHHDDDTSSGGSRA